MNERIQELWEQAVHGDGPHASVIADFAELIVRECARIADFEKDKSAGCGYITKTKGEEIKEYFGVRE